MKVGDKVRVKVSAWRKHFGREGLIRPVRTVVSIRQQGQVMLDFPFHWWEPEELENVDSIKSNFERLFNAVQKMWGRRYDTDPDEIPEPHEGPSHRCPVAVDLGDLAVAHSEALAVAEKLTPNLYQEYKGFPGEVDSSKMVLDIRDKQLRHEREFESEAVAYVEAIWGKETFAFDAAVQDLEQMRRGTGDKALRPPETDYEAELLIRHVRDLANGMARLFNQPDLIRPEDDIRRGADDAS